MDDRSFFGSFMFNFFKPFITPNFDYNTDSLREEENHCTQEYTDASGVSPRDSLLKPDKKKHFANPYSDEGRNEKPDGFTFHWNPHQHSDNEDDGGDRFDDFSFGDSFSHNFDGFGDFNSMFRMMDELFEKSHIFNPEIFDKFEDFSGFSNVPSIDSKPFEERKDKDLDDSSGKEIASLLKESPSYQPKSEQSPAVSSSRFRSTSIVRIRRPDGVIEETRKYRDSDGREETEIITHEPGAEGSSQTVDPFTDNSSLSTIFKRFPFTIF